MTIRQRFILECNRMRKEGFDIPKGYVKQFPDVDKLEGFTRKELRYYIARGTMFYMDFRAVPGWYAVQLIDGTFRENESLGIKEM